MYMKLYLNTPENYRSGIFDIQRNMNLSVYGTNSIYDTAVKGKPKDTKAIDEAFAKGYAEGLPDGFLAPDIAVFEGDSILPTLTTHSPLDLGKSKPINEYARKLRIKEVNERIDSLNAEIDEWEGDVGYVGAGKLKSQRNTLMNTLDNLNNNPNFNMSKAIARKISKAPRLDRYDKNIVHGTSITIGDDFSIMNRKAIHFLEKHGIDPIDRVVDLRENPISKEELISKNYKVREMLKPPSLMPGKKKVVEMKLDDILTDDFIAEAALALTDREIVDMLEDVDDEIMDDEAALDKPEKEPSGERAFNLNDPLTPEMEMQVKMYNNMVKEEKYKSAAEKEASTSKARFVAQLASSNAKKKTVKKYYDTRIAQNKAHDESHTAKNALDKLRMAGNEEGAAEQALIQANRKLVDINREMVDVAKAAEVDANKNLDTFNAVTSNIRDKKAQLDNVLADTRAIHESRVVAADEKIKELDERIKLEDDKVEDAHDDEKKTKAYIRGEIEKKLPQFIKIDAAIRIEQLDAELKKLFESARSPDITPEQKTQVSIDISQNTQDIIDLVQDDYIDWITSLHPKDIQDDVLLINESKLPAIIIPENFSRWAAMGLVKEWEAGKNIPVARGGVSLHGNSSFSNKIKGIFGEDYYNKFKADHAQTK